MTPLLAIITSRVWRAGLAAASRFANYCPRLVVTPPLGEEGNEALATAGRLAIGVAISGTGPLNVLAEPVPVRGWQPTTAWWRFCEQVYGQAVQLDVPGTRPTPPKLSELPGVGHALGPRAHREAGVGGRPEL